VTPSFGCPSPATPRFARLAVLLLASTVLVGADCLGSLIDDDDGEPVLYATNGGEVGRVGSTGFEAIDIWSGSIPSANRVVMVVDATQAYVGGGTSVASFALEASGENVEVWTWSAPDDVVAMAGPGGGVLFVMTTSSLHGLGTDGGEIWSVDLLLDMSGVADSALGFGGGTLVLGGDPTRRLDPGTGQVTHTLATGSTDVSAVVVGGASVYIATSTGLMAASAGTLTEQWFHETDAEIDAVAASADAVAYAVRGGVVGLLTSGGNPVFDTGAQTGVFDGLALAGNLVLAARADGTLLGWDEADGAELWSATRSGPVGGLGATADTVYYGHGSDLEALSLSDGGNLWTRTTSGNPVAVLPL
jgi:hypothetical protein